MKLPTKIPKDLTEREQLHALCLRYGGPDGSDWGELLAWIEDALESRHQTEVIADSPPSPQFDFDEGTIS